MLLLLKHRVIILKSKSSLAHAYYTEYHKYKAMLLYRSFIVY